MFFATGNHLKQLVHMSAQKVVHQMYCVFETRELLVGRASISNQVRSKRRGFIGTSKSRSLFREPKVGCPFGFPSNII